MSEKAKAAAELISKNLSLKYDAAIILGSGLSHLADQINIIATIAYSEIPGFPESTVPGHEGKLVAGILAGKTILALKGRFHYYEGYTMQEVVFPIRVLHHLGINTLILSNAAGGTNPEFRIGDIMLIRDHINLMGTNPLIGKNDETLGPRFPDMSQVYDPGLLQAAREVAIGSHISLKEGIYAAVTGPVYETPAEYRYIRILGADAVGMSTVPEAIAARHLGMRLMALSVITDLGVEGKIQKITHEEVLTAAAASEPFITTIIKGVLKGNS
ncbi:MAG TPA: purine-nucleoside phosphorylase [Bacteroidales bacterium]|nr:purine-nucleoside phosphorylase [Bacteroidales bacterium]HRZ49649.1 purine-nucleoside phosphorylase [Bacteroidales bacterium]